MAINTQFTICNLSNEILYFICSQLPPKTLESFALTGHELRKVALDEKLWDPLIRKRFSDAVRDIPGIERFGYDWYCQWLKRQFTLIRHPDDTTLRTIVLTPFENKLDGSVRFRFSNIEIKGKTLLFYTKKEFRVWNLDTKTQTFYWSFIFGEEKLSGCSLINKKTALLTTTRHPMFICDLERECIGFGEYWESSKSDFIPLFEKTISYMCSDGQYLYVGDMTGTISVLNPSTKELKPVWSPFTAHKSSVHCMKIYDGLLYTRGDDEAFPDCIKVWTLSSNSPPIPQRTVQLKLPENSPKDFTIFQNLLCFPDPANNSISYLSITPEDTQIFAPYEYKVDNRITHLFSIVNTFWKKLRQSFT